MRAYSIFVLFANACSLQIVMSQCIGHTGAASGLLNQGSAYDGLSLGTCGIASAGGSFPITSASPVPPTGLSVVSENLYEGGLFLEGKLPLLGSVALEGTMGTAGAGAVSYGCGDDAAGIFQEGPIVTGILAPGVGPGASCLAGKALVSGLSYGTDLGYGSGLIGAGVSSGCGTVPYLDVL